MTMEMDLFRGDKVRLTAEKAEVLAEAFSRWRRDTLYWRFLDTGPASVFSAKAIKDRIEKELYVDSPDFVIFGIRSLEDDRLLGEIGLDLIQDGHGETFVGLGLGERDDWGNGYGTDAMRIILRYAFDELNLHRVALDVFEYNPRAIRSYEKTGFKYEGRMRRALHRDGRRWDLIFMGILREEWIQLQAGR